MFDCRALASYIYDPTGRLIRVVRGSGAYTEIEYTPAGQLFRHVNRAADGAVISSFEYSYDRFGRCLGLITLLGSWTYEYDARHRS